MQSTTITEQLERKKVVFENEGEAAEMCLVTLQGIVIEPTVTV